MINDYVNQEVRQLATMKAQLEACIDQMPDNPNIRRVAKNAFVMRASELTKHDNWVPTFHDFQAQYRLILDRLDKVKSMAEFQTFLANAVEKRQIKVGKHIEKLHPKVVSQLQRLL